MCTGNIRVNDAVMERVKPYFGGDRELWHWIENVVDKAMKDYAAQYETEMTNVEKNRIYEEVMALENDPEGFLKLGAVMKPSPFSAEELRDEYISEKYGV